MNLNAHLIGRLGNQMFQYAYARAFAEREGMELRTNKWIGQQIFEDINEKESDGTGKSLPDNYRQTQNDLIYTRKQVKEWFRFKDEISKKLGHLSGKLCVGHRRVGDYYRCGYVVVSVASYERFAPLFFVTEEGPILRDGFIGEMSCVPDFYTMVRSRVLIRGNSCFSWWAATLSNAKVYAPIIEGKQGGMEHDCEFVEGNWPRLANLPCVTDLHLKEE